MTTSYAAQYYRPPQQVQSHQTRSSGPIVADDYERWYTEATHSNRMVLSLKSGLDEDVSWALDRLCRLSHNEQFNVLTIPGLLDALFELPTWYACEGSKQFNDLSSVFGPSRELSLQRRHALEALFVLRNAALLQVNLEHVLSHASTFPFILQSLHNLDPSLDHNVEFILHTIDLLHSVSGNLALPKLYTPATWSPVGPLQGILATSFNRPTIIAALTTLTQLFSNPINVMHMTSDAPSLEAAVKYMPLFGDKALVDACIGYMFAHLSHPPMAKAFLLHPSMPRVLRIMVSHLIKEQIEEASVLDVSAPIHTVPVNTISTHPHELTTEELDGLLHTTEPQRCYDWMNIMFVEDPSAEMTQVEFWNLYRDTFSHHESPIPVLAAADVIKNVSIIFTQAQAMVIPGETPRFIIRGVARRQDASHTVNQEKFKCLWNRSQCPSSSFNSTTELYEHVLDHLKDTNAIQTSCEWHTCSAVAPSKNSLCAHILTHISVLCQNLPLPPSQSDTITLPDVDSTYPIKNPTTRPILPHPHAVTSFPVPVIDPPSSALTALLCLRILFRTSFADNDAAPRADADHFGFPGVVEDVDEKEAIMGPEDREREKEGQILGKKAFSGISALMQNVRIKNDVLMEWINEMIQTSWS